ncbi:hypothetical protein ACSTDZ_21280 [Vibrio vulnificus]|uniref:hypothetical protein n=1 Tax=Vibrio vulnificus TaxID=672 RepID=UPI0009B63CD1|nr:hypothetical protein [Vibrio vulnificus]OQK63856.1 putative membrane protein [Vibrio vulnificus]OQK66358.1 putative membrane protein [Vibrio vulnificus]
MSETAGTVIKLLAALTSPKACVKYITVAVFLYLSWIGIEPLLAAAKIGTEQKSLIILLFGVGVGSLVGHIISSITYHYWDKFCQSKEAAKIQESEKQLARAEQVAFESANRKLVEQIQSMFEHLTLEQKKLLRELTRSDKTINTGDSENEALIKNNFIHKVMQVQYRNYVVRINPVISDFVKNQWEAELDFRIDEFLATSSSKELLNLMGTNEVSDKVNPSLFDSLSNISGILRVGLDDEVEGYWLWFDDHILERMESKFAMSLVDERFYSAEQLQERT